MLKNVDAALHIPRQDLMILMPVFFCEEQVNHVQGVSC